MVYLFINLQISMSFLGKNAARSQNEAEEPNRLQNEMPLNQIQSKILHFADAAAIHATPDPSKSIKTNGSEY